MKATRSLSLYWKCQLIGWSVASLYWNFMGFIGTNFSPWLAVIHFAGDLLIYIPVTHLYRTISVRQGWHQLQPRKLLTRLIPSVIILGGLFVLLTVGKNHLIRYWFEYGYTGTLEESFRSETLTTFMTGMRLMSIWLLAYYGYHYAQREINATRESARLALIAKEAQLNNLTAQLNPHFFFNSLNNIKALVMEDPRAARRAIDLLSEVLRTALYNRDTPLITLQQEMALVEDYLELEKLRFEERLHTQITIDVQLAHTAILPLSIQTLVENAIKHGIAQRKSGGSISIKVEQHNGHLQATVQNPGILQAQHNGGLGLKNLQERLQLQFGGQASLHLTQLTTETVLATITMPRT
ncbi:MAG: histidine kinase [Niastella sp.]|nr:histidine kinase [Niastella sp.]